jgi:hypothetical protein
MGLLVVLEAGVVVWLGCWTLICIEWGVVDGVGAEMGWGC